jgi:GT2 family glycosyltransferase
MSPNNTDQLTVVLGMHRSGTSAITRALQVFGIRFGDRLMPAMEDNNEKGFWEDRDLHELSTELLNTMGSDWHTLEPVRTDKLLELTTSAYFQKAVDLLRLKIETTPGFAFKNPRSAKLLLFWKAVFNYCGLNTQYIIALRNPLSVCKSLEKRDGFDSRVSYLLWIEHLLYSLLGTTEETFLIVDYDKLMESPKTELDRIGKKLDLKILPHEYEEYTLDFLDESLRHTVFSLSDLIKDPTAPELIKDMYSHLIDVGSGEKELSITLLKQWESEFQRLKPLLGLVDNLSLKLQQAQTESDKKISSSEGERTEIERQLLSMLHNSQQALKSMEFEKQHKWLESAETDFNTVKTNIEIERSLQEKVVTLHDEYERREKELNNTYFTAQQTLIKREKHLQEQLQSTQKELENTKTEHLNKMLAIAELELQKLQSSFENERKLLEMQLQFNESKNTAEAEFQKRMQTALREAAEKASETLQQQRTEQELANEKHNEQCAELTRSHDQALSQSRSDLLGKLATMYCALQQSREHIIEQKQCIDDFIGTRIWKLAAPFSPDLTLQIKKLKLFEDTSLPYDLETFIGEHCSVQSALSTSCTTNKWIHESDIMPIHNTIAPHKISSLDDLLGLFDKNFIHAAYVHILGRAPDSEGFGYYLNRLRRGDDKISLLHQLYNSPEATRSKRPVQLSGFDKAMRKENIRKNYFARVVLNRLPFNRTNQKINAFENNLSATVDRQGNSLDHISNKLNTISKLIDQQSQRITDLGALKPTFSISNGPLVKDNANSCSQASDDIKLIQDSELFDKGYYFEKYSDVTHAGLDPLEHYVKYGGQEGRNPNALFDSKWYLETYPDVAGNPLIHYIRYGALEGRLTCSSFDSGWYLETYTDVRENGLNPLEHYLHYGLQEGRKINGETLEQLSRHAPDELSIYFKKHTAYDSWIAVNQLTNSAIEDINQRLVAWKGRLNTISLICPVYNTPPELLKELVDSVMAQIYPNWELCLVDDASTHPHVKPLLKELGALDPRIRISRMGKNGGISLATNQAVDMARGEIIAFLDHDDLITPDCLAEIALYYAEHQEADIVYSDDDKIDLEQNRFAPQFKPDWSPTLLLSYMYLGHIFTVRKSLFLELGGFRKEFDGSQDYDFALRAAEKARHVGHIPRILYHWRVVPGSTACSGDAKPASLEAGRKAVQEALVRRGTKANRVIHPEWAQAGKVGMFSINFPDKGPLVTIIIPTFNQVDLLKTCVESLCKTTYANYKVLVIDNASDDKKTLRYLDKIKHKRNHTVVTIQNRDGKFSFARLMNEAVKKTSSEYVLLLNNDTELINPQWLSQMVGYAQMEGVGSVGARLYFEDYTIQHAGIIHGYHRGLAGHAFRGKPSHDWGYMGFMRTAREYSALTAACLLTPKALFEQLGGFDENDFAVAYNDVDYGYRLVKAGYRNIYCPEAELFHYEGKTRGFSDHPHEVRAYRKRYNEWYDRWYNPNLTLDNEAFQPWAVCLPAHNLKKLHIVAVSHNLNFEGAPAVLQDLIIGLVNKQVITATVISPCDGPLREAYESAGIPVRISIDPQAGVTDAAIFLEALQHINQQFSELGADVVIANTLATFWAITAASNAGIPAIWCQHESEPWQNYYDYLSPALRPYAYASFARAYRVTYVADATRQAWKDVETRANFQVIPYAIPPKRLSHETGQWKRETARKQLGIEAGQLALVLVGTLCRRKNQQDLIEAFMELPETIQNHLKIFIVGAEGEPEYAKKLKASLSHLPEEIQKKVVFTGPVNGASQYFSAGDIFACTSLIESAPRVIIEAMAFGLPIVTTPVFGIPEIVRENINAVFYNPGDTNRLTEIIQQLVENQTLRDTLASNSRAVLESLPSFDNMLSSYELVLQQAAMLRNAPENMNTAHVTRQ